MITAVADRIAATDSGFSTAWSKDGRKFAVASQGESSVLAYWSESEEHLALFHCDRKLNLQTAK